MTTISKFYLHNATTANTGTMPGSGDAFIGSGDVDGDASGARTPCRIANDTIGVLQTSSALTSTASVNAQNWGHRRFVSAPLAAHTFASADGNWTFSYARSESNTNHNGQFVFQMYAWRPSTGARVGSGAGFIAGAGLAATGELADSATGTWASATGSTTILDGDILVFEVSDFFTQSKATAYTSTFFYDGTTEASTTSCASFVTPPAALDLYTPSVLSFPQQFHAIPFVSPGRI